MKFSKGQSGNPGGRPKGAKNKANATLRDVIAGVLNNEMTPAKLKKILQELPAGDRLNYLIRLTDFVLPKLRQTDVSFDLEKLSESQLDVIIARLLTNKTESDEEIQRNGESQ